MKSTPSSLARRSIGKRALAVLGGALLLAVAPGGAELRAADASPAPARSDQKPSLPVTTTFVKATTGENQGLFELKVTNTSPHVLTITASILASVQTHSQDKIREVGPQVIEPGKDWTIDRLAALDKVTLKAEGFEPLELVVH